MAQVGLYVKHPYKTLKMWHIFILIVLKIHVELLLTLLSI